MADLASMIERELTIMASKKNQSPSRKFLQILWDNRMDATAWSWERLNHAMSGALLLAIRAGMRFSGGDFEAIHSDFRGHYWFGTDNDHSQGERFYSAAVEVGNLSACQSFEKWRNRQPFIFEGKRLHHGAIIEWKGETVAVTSFSKDGDYLTLCSYTERPYRHGERTYYHGKVKKRFKLTLVELRATENEKRKAKKGAAKPGDEKG
jgi:hypothetical protein